MGRRFTIAIAMLVVVGIIGGHAADAGEGRPGKGFWKILVKPKAKWVLKNTIAAKLNQFVDSIVVETYDVRKVGKADVARLRWTHHMENDGVEADALKFTQARQLTQVAVTDAGIYLLTADMDDAKIAAALKNKPSRSDPPKPYKGTKRNEGRFLDIRNGLVCIGQGPTPEDGPCEDTCEGEICISATAGIVTLSGNWAPGVTEFEQE